MLFQSPIHHQCFHCSSWRWGGETGLNEPHARRWGFSTEALSGLVEALRDLPMGICEGEMKEDVEHAEHRASVLQVLSA